MLLGEVAVKTPLLLLLLLHSFVVVARHSREMLRHLCARNASRRHLWGSVGLDRDCDRDRRGGAGRGAVGCRLIVTSSSVVVAVVGTERGVVEWGRTRDARLVRS